MRQLAALPAAIAIVLVTAVSAAAAGWVPLGDLSDPARPAGEPDIAPGAAVATWKAPVGATEPLYAAFRPPGQPFGSGVPISSEGNSAFAPRLAGNARGDAVAVWYRDNGGTYVVEAATRAPGQPFGPPDPLTEPPNHAVDPAVAMNASGAAAVVWQRTVMGVKVIQISTRAPGAAFSPPETISDTTKNATQPEVVISDAGDIHAVWRLNDGGIDKLQARLRPAGAPWEGESFLTANSVQNPRAAVDDDGNAAFAWGANDGGKTRVHVITRPRGGSYNPFEVISPAGENTQTHRIALDDAGNTVVSWSVPGAPRIVRAATRPAGGAWSEAGVVASSGEDPELAMEGDGTAFVTFLGPGARVMAATKPPGGTFGAPTELSAAGQPAFVPRVAADGLGNGMAVWLRSNGTVNAVQAAAYDATNPELRDVTVPATGTAGTPIRFSAAASDLMTAVTIRWDFGDGGLAESATPNHAYGAAGVYDVTVTARDAAGNETTATRRIAVAAGEVRPPPPVRPQIAGLRISPRTFRAARRGGSITRRRAFPRVTFRLDRAARVTFRVRRRTAGRRVGGRCVKRTRRNRARRRCVRYVRVRGSFARNAKAGANRFRFTGRMRRRKLRPGRYRLVATPRAAGIAGKSARTRFRVRKPKR